MKWYTLANGTVCLGTDELEYANFHVATQVKVDQSISMPLSPSHIGLIGSFPEDWYNDEKIDEKINQAASYLFEFEAEEARKLPEESLNGVIQLVQTQFHEYRHAGLTQISNLL